MASADAIVAEIAAAKKRWETAKTAGDQAAMDAAHLDAEKARATVGFSGGADGSQNIALTPAAAPVAAPAVTVGAQAPAVPQFGSAPAALSAAQLGAAASGAQTAASSSLAASLAAIRSSYGNTTTAPTAPSLPTVADNSTDIERLYAAQQAARISALGKARDASMSALQGEQSAIAPQFEAGRNSAGAASEIQARNFAEYMANRGLAAGAGAQMEISRQGALQAQVGSLNQQEIASNADIERRRSSTTAGYESDVATSQAEISAQQTAALISERNRAYEANYRRAVDMFGMQSQQAQAAYQQMRDAMSDSINVDQIGYSRGRDVVGDAQWSSQDALARWQANNSAAMQQYQIGYQQNRDSVGDSQWQTQYDRSVLEGDRNYDLAAEAQAVSIAATKMDTELAAWKLEIAKDPNSVENRTAALALEQAEFSLAHAREMAKYDPLRAQAELNQIYASTAATRASTARAGSSASGSGAAWDQFMETWRALGYAPENSYNIKPGSVYNPDAVTPKPAPAPDLPGVRDTIIGGMIGTEAPGVDATGRAITTTVAGMPPAAAMGYIATLVESGQITESDANWLVESIPSLATYARTAAGRAGSQTRYDN